MNSVGYLRVYVCVKPKLERKHMLNRFLYCWERLNEVFNARTVNESIDELVIFADKKRFNKITMVGYM